MLRPLGSMQATLDLRFAICIFWHLLRRQTHVPELINGYVSSALWHHTNYSNPAMKIKCWSVAIITGTSLKQQSLKLRWIIGNCHLWKPEMVKIWLWGQLTLNSTQACQCWWAALLQTSAARPQSQLRNSLNVLPSFTTLISVVSLKPWAKKNKK